MSCDASNVAAILAEAESKGTRAAPIGTVTSGGRLKIESVLDVDLAQAGNVYGNAIRDRLDNGRG